MCARVCEWMGVCVRACVSGWVCVCAHACRQCMHRVISVCPIIFYRFAITPYLFLCVSKVSQRPSIDDILRDPVVARRYEQIEASAERHAHSSDSCEGGSGSSGENVNSNNNNNKLGEEDGVVRLKQLEEDYRKKFRQLELKEKELDSKGVFLGGVGGGSGESKLA